MMTAMKKRVNMENYMTMCEQSDELKIGCK